MTSEQACHLLFIVYTRQQYWYVCIHTLRYRNAVTININSEHIIYFI